MLASRVEELPDDGSDEGLRLAGHLAQMVWVASPNDEDATASFTFGEERSLRDVARRLSLSREKRRLANSFSGSVSPT